MFYLGPKGGCLVERVPLSFVDVVPQCYILCYHVIQDPMVIYVPKASSLMYIHMLYHTHVLFAFPKALLGKKCNPLIWSLRSMHVKQDKKISTIDDVLISTVGFMLVRMWTHSQSI